LRLKRLHLKQFRSYPDKEFIFSDSGALIFGPNGSGKTNLFEAIAYNSIGKSVKYQSDQLLMRFDQKGFKIEADFELRKGKYTIQSDYSIGKKRIAINGIPINQLSQIYEYIKVVYCSPDDIYLVNGSPRKRRIYFDMAIAQIVPSYILKLRHFIHIVEQRNALLKDKNNKNQKKHWDDQFIHAALPVIGARLEYIAKLNQKILNLYRETLTEAKNLNIAYAQTLNAITDDTKSGNYTDELSRIETKEWQYQRTLIGPHLDDYDIYLSGKPLKDIGSQGQKRTVTLLIKIAHLEMIKDVIGEYPILLLDDIFAELDMNHIQQFQKILKNHEQVFVASPNSVTADYWNNLPIIELTRVDNSI